MIRLVKSTSYSSLLHASLMVVLVAGCDSQQGQKLCSPGMCSHHGTCDDTSGMVVCSCEPGYTGDHCHYCQTGFEEAADGTCRQKEPEDHCEKHDCGAHGECQEGPEGPRCICDQGYSGEHCDIVDEYCGEESCGFSGECDDSSGVIVCICQTGYSGEACQRCAPGYHRDDTECVADESCLPSSCSGHGICERSDGQVSCRCEEGYLGDNCEFCAGGYQDNDLDGICLPSCALAGIDCGAYGHCSDVSGTALCECDSGYIGTDCRTCAAGYQDNNQDGSCLPCCPTSGIDCGAHGQCLDDSGQALCECRAGYTGVNCQSCAPGYHLEGQVCAPDPNWCGNGLVEAYEECDGNADSSCPGRCSAHCACPSAGTSDRLEVHMIDVGQGDAILVISPDGFVMLVDAGSDWEWQTIYDYLSDLGIYQIDYTFVSHMHADHLGAMDHVLDIYPSVVSCFDNGGTFTTQEYSEYAERAGHRRTTLVAGDVIDLGPAVVASVLHGHGNFANENLNSLVVRLTFGSTSVLLGGDCEASCEESFDPGAIDVYKVHHHAASDSSSESFLSQMEPQFALIPVGSDNPYGHPHSSTLERLAAHQADIFRTNLNGSLRVVCGMGECTVTAEY